ncbi:phosphatase PAP2 family protein [Shewanella sp. UCD-KL12]|uniref:phosphatase PAP2 family protein n=1 Tax=Shewanella sp. UCD-KL12 TaxID=1917163 RepID=UPI000970B21E|nr:phosphatase PAP2 family protein [Shewanella sp. UCD-KL12]
MKKLFSLCVLCLSFNASAHVESINNDWRTYGDYAQIAIPAAGYITAWLKGDSEGAWQLTKGLLITQGIAEVTKTVTDIDRPCGGHRSFPSGHTAAAFSGASFMHHRYGWEYGLPAYLAATGVAYSRVQANKHWSTDVLAGAALAYTVSYFLTDKFEDPNLSVVPISMGKDAQGIAVNYRF